MIKLLFRKNNIVLLFLFFITNKITAQYAMDYTPLKSSGTIPEEFLRTARAMSQAEVKTIGYGKDHDAKAQFTVSEDYFLQNLLLDGDVLINDPLSKYVNKVADELLKDNPTLRSQLHIYVIKNPEVNAHAFDKGFIFVNIGLLAQLENEAQLAYILSHEITHVVKKHSMTEYIENIKLSNGTSEYENGSNEERKLARYRFSKEQETEADVEGLALLKQSKYSVKTVNGAFDVLQYSYLPFELVDFKKSFFEDKNLIFPDTLILKNTQEVKSNDDYDDTKSTHPNIRKRRAAIESELTVDDEASRRKYLVSEEEFKSARENARFELCRLYLRDRDYMNAIYAAYILSEKYPDNIYLKKIIAKALFNVSVNKSSKKKTYSFNMNDGNKLSSKVYSIPDYKTIEGASQRLYYLMDNLSDKELSVVSLKYVYSAHKKYPNDPTFLSLTDSLFSELVNSNDLYLSDFSKKSKAELKVKDTAKVIAQNVADPEESKYSKIKKQQEKVEVETDENFIKYSFVEELKDPEFVKHYTTIARGLTKKADNTSSNAYIYKKDKNKTGDPLLGIDKIIFLDPYYMRSKLIDRTEYVNYYDSEDQQKVLAEIQKKCADHLKLGYSEVSSKGLTESDIEKYNDNALVNEWLETRFKHGNNSDEVVENYESIKQLIDKLGTKYIAWSGVYNYEGRHYKNTYFFVLFNLESGEAMKYETRITKSRDNKDLISSYEYNSLMHVAKKPK